MRLVSSLLMIVALSLLLPDAPEPAAAQAPAKSPAKAPALSATPAPAALVSALVRMEARDRFDVTLRTRRIAGGDGSWASHRVRVGELDLRPATAAVVEPDGDGSRVRFALNPRDLPEAVLDLPEAGLPLVWTATSSDRTITVAGTLDTRRNLGLEVAEPVRDQIARLGPVDVTPSLSALALRALLELHNPFAFDINATAMRYRLTVGGTPVASADRRGFRLRSGQSSDVLIEQEVPLAQLAGAAAGLLGQQPAQLEGSLTIRTPRGERELPFSIATSR